MIITAADVDRAHEITSEIRFVHRELTVRGELYPNQLQRFGQAVKKMEGLEKRIVEGWQSKANRRRG